MADIKRRRSVAVNVGGVKVGGTNPIVVQSMTNTDTADVTSTVNQVMALAKAGSPPKTPPTTSEPIARIISGIVISGPDSNFLFGSRTTSAGACPWP